MKNKSILKIHLLMFLIIGMNTNLLQAQTDSAYFYLGGIQEWFYQQTDVYSFRKTDKTEYTGSLPISIVEKTEYERDGMNYIYFKNTSSLADRQSVIGTIFSDPDFEKDFMVLTKDITSSFAEKEYMPTNDIVEIVFNDENITEAQVSTFATNHFLELVYTPVKGGVYIFRVIPELEVDNIDAKLTLKRAAQIWEQDMTMVAKAAPSLGLFERTSTTDIMYDQMWHVQNDTGISCYGTPGYAGASAKFNQVWNLNNEFGAYQGFTGTDVTVAVIDYGGFQYSHPDMQNVYLEGKYISADTAYSFNADEIITTDTIMHGHAAASIIAANEDNGYGIAGVAFNAKIFPILLPNLRINFTDALNMALNECLLTVDSVNSVDVINMSFGTEFQGSIINAQSFPLTTTIAQVHRVTKDNVDYKGIPMIASAGNGNGYNKFLPALYEEVFSVGSTTPRDKRKVANFNQPSGWGIDYTSSADGFDAFSLDSLGDTTFRAWGSSYFIDLDVVAPGTCIPALSYFSINNIWATTLYDGYEYLGNPQPYGNFTGTSASAPMVSGLAALLLEKYPNFTAEQVYNAIRNGTEKVGGYNYSDTIVNQYTNQGILFTDYYYTPNPKHLEMGYGRINAFNTVFNTDTTVNNHLDQDFPNANPISAISEVHNDFNYFFNNPCTEYLNIELSKNSDYEIEIYDVNGKKVYEGKMNNENKTSISVKEMSKGLYFLNIYNEETNSFVNSKFIKL